jgi:hypothetical protein
MSRSKYGRPESDFQNPMTIERKKGAELKRQDERDLSTRETKSSLLRADRGEGQIALSGKAMP